MPEAPARRSTVITRVAPGLGSLWAYQPAWLRQDLVAGLVLTALLVPQGMAYAELAGLPAITGLYTTVLCLIGYAVFGPSRVLVLGPDSSLGPMIAATVIPLAAAQGDPDRAVAYASLLALMVGAITLLAGVFKLGFVAEKPGRRQEWMLAPETKGVLVMDAERALTKVLTYRIWADQRRGWPVGWSEAPSAADGNAHRLEVVVHRALEQHFRQLGNRQRHALALDRRRH